MVNKTEGGLPMVLKNALLNGDLCDIEIIDGKISAIGKIDKDGIDLNGNRIYAGLIEIHAHGCIGYDTMDGDKLTEMSVYQAENGITTWYPTTMTMPVDDVQHVTDVDLTKVEGANVPGFHLEGPFISMKYKGAQDPEYVIKPDVKIFNSIKNAKLITIAPEVEGAYDFIKECNAVVCLGHTDATYDEAVKAFECGAKCLTHTFNAMPPLHHRNPGVIGAGMMCNGYAQVIGDGLHVHPAAFIALYKMFTSDRLVIISDTLRAADVPEGEYTLGYQKIIVKDGLARLEDGTIAGSTNNLFKCVKRVIGFGIDADEAFKMASLTPAKLMGIDDAKGSVEIGKDADLIVVDKNYDLKMSMVGGKIYKNEL